MEPLRDQTKTPKPCRQAEAKPLVLASRSPRRHALLAEAGIEHVAPGAGVDDSLLAMGAASPAEWAASLAYLKARAGAELAESRGLAPCLVLGADTVCVLGGRVIGQPADRADAEWILRSFCGTTHEVITGVALLDTETGERDVFVDRASVTWGDVPDERIAEYLDSERWRGKAGAYNLGERLDAGWPITYTGDPTTIVGLPMRALCARLGARCRCGGNAA